MDHSQSLDIPFLIVYRRNMRTFEYRLYPTAAQQRLLLACLKETREAYNAMLAYLKAQYERDHTFPKQMAVPGY